MQPYAKISVKGKFELKWKLNYTLHQTPLMHQFIL